MKYPIFILFVLSVFVITTPVFAQLGQTDLNLNLSPENPGSNQTVTASITSYSANLNSATITWVINGKTIKKAVGETSFQFVTGNPNATTNLSVIARTSGGETLSQSVILKPANVDLIWQTDSYTPPFYKGKAMYSHQNKITFIALPHITNSNGAEIGAKNLIYKWSNNGTVIDPLSGYGKDTYTIVGSIISRPLNIEVSVTSPSSGGTALAEARVAPTEPVVLFYKKNPLYGMEFQNALSGEVALLDSKEITVVGVPFFFGTRDLYAPELSYKWSVNGVSIDEDTTQTTRVFRQPEGIGGTSNISLSVENSDKILQFASSNFNLNFSNATQ